MDNKVSSSEEHILEDDFVGSPFTESPFNSGSANSSKSTPAISNKNMSFSSPDGMVIFEKDCEDARAEHLTFNGSNMEETDCVVVIADYIVYKGIYYPAPAMTFCDRSIKIECKVMDKDMDKDVETLVYEWAVDDDVLSIESQGYRGSMVRVRIHVLTKSVVKTENMHNISGVEELKVMLFDPEWLLSMEKIMSLNMRYKDAWKVLATSEFVDDGDDSPGIPTNESQLSLRLYFPDLGEQFDEVIYPEGDVDAVSITKGDVDLLNPETFINDTIIDFYIKYLKNKIPVGERNRFHFFNSFFFRKLADLDKNPDSILDGKAAFQRVRKWTRKVNLFEKDYIFIPVNYSLHWSLIIICHPGEVADCTDEKINESSRVPCILHMDSISGSHAGLKNLVQSYLLEEWKERQKVANEDISSKFLNLRFLSLELPQQENFYDCGLFLLHYAELFLKDAPTNFNPFNIEEDSFYLTPDWFIPGDVSLKRPYIQRLIRDILVNRSQGNIKNSISTEGVADLPKFEECTGMELISVRCNPQNACVPASLYSGPLHEIDMNLRGGSPVRSSECHSQPNLAFTDLLQTETSSELLFNEPKLEEDNGMGLVSLSCNLGSFEQSRDESKLEEDKCMELVTLNCNLVSFDQSRDEPKLEENNGMQLISLSCNLESFEQPRGAMSPIQEEVGDEDATDHLYSMQYGSNLGQVDGSTNEGCKTYTSNGSWARNFDMMGDHNSEEDDSSAESLYDSDDGVKLLEENPEIRDSLPPQNNKPDMPKCSQIVILDSVADSFASATSDLMATPTKDSHQYFGVLTNSEGDDLLPYAGENELQESSQEPEDEGATEEDEGPFINGLSSDPEEQQPAKRLKLSVDWESGPETELLKEK